MKMEADQRYEFHGVTCESNLYTCAISGGKGILLLLSSCFEERTPGRRLSLKSRENGRAPAFLVLEVSHDLVRLGGQRQVFTHHRVAANRADIKVSLGALPCGEIVQCLLA